VGLQRYPDRQVKRRAIDFISTSATRELSNCVPVSQIKLPTDLLTLRNASIAWLLDGYKFFTYNRDIVKNAWAQSKVAGLNLTWDSLTSEETLRNLNSLQKSYPEFNQEFSRFDPKALATVSGDPEADKNIVSDADCEFADDDTSLSTEELVTQRSDPSSAEGSGLAPHEDFVETSSRVRSNGGGFIPLTSQFRGVQTLPTMKRLRRLALRTRRPGRRQKR